MSHGTQILRGNGKNRLQCLSQEGRSRKQHKTENRTQIDRGKLQLFTFPISENVLQNFSESENVP